MTEQYATVRIKVRSDLSRVNALRQTLEVFRESVTDADTDRGVIIEIHGIQELDRFDAEKTLADEVGD